MARLASGISAVNTMSLAWACSTIQSSAASAPADTTTTRIIGSRDGLTPPLLTKVTTRPSRSATLMASSLTGQASASTKMIGSIRSGIGNGFHDKGQPLRDGNLGKLDDAIPQFDIDV